MLSDIRRLFYGIVKIDNVEFVNKLKPNFFVSIIELFKYYIKKLYYIIPSKIRFEIFKNLLI